MKFKVCNIQHGEEDFCVMVSIHQDPISDLTVVQCLDYDIASQGKTEEAAMIRFERCFIVAIEAFEKYGVNFRESLAEAPPEYWKGCPI
jgi:hypothetical protein